MKNGQSASCYGVVSNQSHHLPMLISPADPTPCSTEEPTKEDDNARSRRLFGREGVLMHICGGPTVKRNAIEMAFADVAVAL